MDKNNSNTSILTSNKSCNQIINQNQNFTNNSQNSQRKRNVNSELKVQKSTPYNFLKVKKGSIYNAYERKNLGSIPSKFDNFIFKLPEESKINLTTTLQKVIMKDENFCYRKDIFNGDHKSWNNFGSGNSVEFKGNSLKFTVNNNLRNLNKSKSQYDLRNIEPFKTFYTNSNRSTNVSNINNSLQGNNNINSFNNNKSLTYSNSVIIKDSNIYNNLNSNNENINSSLNAKNSSISFISNQNENSQQISKFPKEDRYDNVFYKKDYLKRYYPGPGDYESLINKSKKFRYDSLFKDKSSFPLIDLHPTMYGVGPGSYNLVKDKKHILGGPFSKVKKYEIINNPFPYNYEEGAVGPGANNLPGGIKVKEKNKKNYFFLPPSPPKENLEKKFELERNDKIDKIVSEIEVFGENPKSGRWSSNEQTKNFENDWINRNLEKKLKEEIKKGNFNIKELDEVKEYTKYDREKKMRNEREKEELMVKNKKDAYSFSKIPKFYNLNYKHVPGPSYYEPEKIMKGVKQIKQFNSRSGVGWI